MSKSHLDSNWYVVGPPWGKGDYVIAGHNDPHIGIFVADCDSWLSKGLQEAFPDWDIASPQEIAQRIADDHNECLKLRRRIEVLEKRLEEKRTVKQDIEELFGA